MLLRVRLYDSFNNDPHDKPHQKLSLCTDQFTEFYYNTFDQDRAKLAALYV